MAHQHTKPSDVEVVSVLCFLQAGLEDLTYREGVLALGHAAAVTFDCLSDHFLQYLEERTTPALVAFAVHQVSSKSQICFFTEV